MKNPIPHCTLSAVLLILVACSDAAVSAPADDVSAVDAPDASASDVAAVEVAEDVAADTTATSCPGAAGCACTDDGECDDGDPCSTNQTCPNGTCTAGTSTCDDNNVCTSDACDKSGTCLHSAHDGFCEDGDPCTIADTCTASACVPGKARTCDDDNACTADICQKGIGCVYLATDATCVDENTCTFAGACHLGHCVDGKAKPCDDGSPCTWDTCMPESGCTSFAVPLTNDCTDTVANGRCWVAIAASLPWAEARAACHTWGGELAAVRSLPDNVFVRALATATCGEKNAWIGLSDHAQEGHWHWTDAIHGGFGNWADGEPNNAGGSKTDDGEDFGVISTDGYWNDVNGATVEPCLVCARPLTLSCDEINGCTTGARCESGICLPATGTATCDDGNACTADACTPDTGCSHAALAETSSCGIGSCTAGICVASTTSGQELPSCAAILAANASTPTDGLYAIDPDGAGPIAAFSVWCDMHSEGGGWTLAMKIDGADAKFAYDGDPWLKPIPFGNGTLDTAAAVLPSAWALPITAVRIGMRDEGVWRWLTLPVEANSLQTLFTAGNMVATTAGMPNWEALFADASLQAHCQLEGFNVITNSTSLRIGIQGNNENDCATVDSWIGLGAKSNVCGMTDKPTAGDMACYGGDNGDRATTVFGAVLVR